MDAARWLELFIALASVVGIIITVLRRGQRSLEEHITAEIEQATLQIQPLTNGGLSLSDVNHKVDALDAKVDTLIELIKQR